MAHQVPSPADISERILKHGLQVSNITKAFPGEKLIHIKGQGKTANGKTDYTILQPVISDGIEEVVSSVKPTPQPGNVVLQDYIIQYQDAGGGGEDMQEEAYYTIPQEVLNKNALYTVITEQGSLNQQSAAGVTTQAVSECDVGNIIIEQEMGEGAEKPVEIYIESTEVEEPEKSMDTQMHEISNHDKENTGQEKLDETENDPEICQVRVELTDQRYLADMDNIDLFVMYTCKKCGYGNQNVAEAIVHSRSCKSAVEENDINDKFMKVVKLFKTFNHRSVPLTECIAGDVSQPKANNKVNGLGLGEVKIESISKNEPELGVLSEDTVQKVVDMCIQDWQDVKDNAAKETDDNVSINLEPRKWFCSACTSTVIFSEKEYEQHLKAHSSSSCTDTKKFSCMHCAEGEDRRRILQCDDWNTMKTHITTVHKVDLQLECEICEEKLPNHQKYHKHMREHKHYCAFNMCGYSSSRLETVTVHQHCHTSEGTFKCFKCDWTSESNPKKWTLMHMHLTRNHPGTIDPLYKCTMCLKEFPEIRRFNAHLTMCKKLPAPLCPTCLICGKSVLESELKDHILKHSQSSHWYAKFVDLLMDDHDEPSSLQTVPKDSKIKRGFKQKRILVSSGLLKYKCQFCYKKFASQYRLDRHVLHIHPGGDVSTVCETCGSSFRNREQWRNHNRQVHLGIKRKHKPRRDQEGKANKIYMCDTCTYATPSIARLRNHYSTIHLGVFPFNCDKCSYKTNEQSDLKRHMLKHTGEKPFACDYCSYKTTQRWILVNHCDRQHGVHLPKKTQNTLGCQWSLKRGGRYPQADIREKEDEATKSVLSQEEPSAVQYILDQVSGEGQEQQENDPVKHEHEVVLHIAGDEMMTDEAAMMLASLSATNNPETILMQDNSATSNIVPIKTEKEAVNAENTRFVHIITE